MRLTRELIYFFAVGVLMFVGAAAAQDTAKSSGVSVTPKELIGEWTLVSIYDTPNIIGIDYKQANSLLKSRITYRDGYLSACNQRVRINKVERNVVTAAEFLAGRRYTHFSDVGVTTPSISEITINDGETGNCFMTGTLPGEDVSLKSEDEILVDFQEVYYRGLRTASPKNSKHHGLR